MRRARRLGCTALLLVCTAACLRSEWYVAGYLGGSTSRASTVRIDQDQAGAATRLNFETVPLRGRSFESPVHYGYRVGRFGRAWIGFEGEFIHLKVHADLDRPVHITGQIGGQIVDTRAPMREFAQQFEVSHGLNLLLGNVVARRSLLQDSTDRPGRLLLTAKAGAGVTIPRPETIVLGVPSGEYQLGPAVLQAAGGAEFQLWRWVYVLAEYKYTWTPSRFDLSGGEARMKVHSQHLVSGLALHF